MTVPEIQTDTTLNGIDLKKWKSEIVWLENPEILTQEFSGIGLEFLGGVFASSIDIENRINNRLELDSFMKNVARTDREFILQGPVNFNSYASAEGDIIYTGLLNGAIDLNRDVVLLHSDQDFSHFGPQNALVFDSTVDAKNVIMNGLLNDRIRTGDFVLRSDLIAEELNKNVVPGFLDRFGMTGLGNSHSHKGKLVLLCLSFY